MDKWKFISELSNIMHCVSCAQKGFQKFQNFKLQHFNENSMFCSIFQSKFEWKWKLDGANKMAGGAFANGGIEGDCCCPQAKTQLK